jgi:hypothetical protein
MFDLPPHSSRHLDDTDFDRSSEEDPDGQLQALEIGVS